MVPKSYLLFYRLFENGLDLDISKLYPPVQFPVSRGTPMIAPLIKWDHKQDYFVYKFDERIASEKTFTVNLQDQEFEFISGHEIDGEFEKCKKNCRNIIKLIYLKKQEEFYSPQLVTYSLHGKQWHISTDSQFKILILSLRM